MTEAQIRDQCTYLADLLVRKNHDYGDSADNPPILLPGLSSDSAILVRMSDKIERTRFLLESKETPEVYESLEDTIRDLAGYCILWLIKNDQKMRKD